MKPKYGVFIGRFQPFHIGHQAIINEILLDGLIPVIVLGSSNEDRDINKNPLTFKQRKKLIRLIYPNIEMIFIESNDYEDWDKWFYFLQDKLRKKVTYFPHSETIVYHNNKEIDKSNFLCYGKVYENTWFTDIFVDRSYQTKEIPFAERPDLHIGANARDIRSNLEGNKHLLDARVYNQLKKWGWQ